MQTMQYICIPAPGRCEIKTMQKPVPQKGEVLIKLLWAGICGSDMSTYKGTFIYSSYPRIPFHEFSAEIVALGEGAGNLKPGMVVTVNPYYQCGECYSCERGHFNCCQNIQVLGAQCDGAGREYFTVPAERVFDCKNIDAQTLALIEPFCISNHAVRQAGIKPGEHVLIMGAGPIGILALLAAKAKGAAVTMCDLSARRLERAAQMGADFTINSKEQDFDKAVKEIRGDKGFDVCMECVGIPATFQNCIDAAAFHGRVVLVGIGSKELAFKFSVLQTKELNILGSRNAKDEDFAEIIEAVSSGKYDIKPLITNVYDFADAPKAFEDILKNGDTMLKTMIRF